MQITFLFWTGKIWFPALSCNLYFLCVHICVQRIGGPHKISPALIFKELYDISAACSSFWLGWWEDREQHKAALLVTYSLLCSETTLLTIYNEYYETHGVPRGIYLCLSRRFSTSSAFTGGCSHTELLPLLEEEAQKLFRSLKMGLYEKACMEVGL